MKPDEQWSEDTSSELPNMTRYLNFKGIYQALHPVINFQCDGNEAYTWQEFKCRSLNINEGRWHFTTEQIQLHITNSHLTYGFVCTPPVCQTTWNYPRATWKDTQTVIAHTQKNTVHQSFNVDFDVDVNLFCAKRSRISNTTPIIVNRLRPIWLLQLFQVFFSKGCMVTKTHNSSFGRHIFTLESISLSKMRRAQDLF